MKNVDHFHMAEELNLLFDSDRQQALKKAIDYVNAHPFDLLWLESKCKILPTRLELLLKKERRFEDAETERFLMAVIEMLARYGIPSEPEY